MSKVLVDRELMEQLQEKLDPHRDAVLWGDVCDALRRAQPTEAEGVVTKIECTTCRGTGSLEFEGGAVVKDCAPCKGTGRDLKAERYALAARLAESIAALSAVTAERDQSISLTADYIALLGEAGVQIDQLRAEVEGLREDAERWRYVRLQGDDTHWLNLLRVDLDEFGGNINAAVDALIDGEAPAMAAKEA